jgi:hypothetical protein
MEQLLGEEPEAHGYKTVGWTVPLLAIHFAEVEGVPVSETSPRRVLNTLGYRWKRPRYVLARRDPERAGKKRALVAEVARVRAEEPTTVVLSRQPARVERIQRTGKLAVHRCRVQVDIPAREYQRLEVRDARGDERVELRHHH